MNPLQKAFWIGKGVGWDNVPRRVLQSARVRSGVLRKRLAPERFIAPTSGAKVVSEEARREAWQQRRQRFFPLASRDKLRAVVPEAEWMATVGNQCDSLLEGRYPFFSHGTEELGWPPDFNLDPINSVQWPVGTHWLQTTRSGPPRNDIKLVWEASRFTPAFALARHFVYTGDDRWAEAFWEMFDAWREQNPVNQTVAWGCGQETAFRLMAALFAAFVTLDSPAATGKRLDDLELFCWQSAERISANINYAISQENNHALSEAVGLWTVGLLFPDLPRAPKWVRDGGRILERESRRQIYNDGSYVQHSMSYHRVMLDDMVWAIQLGRINGQKLSAGLVERVGRAVAWLSEFIEPTTGRVPNYGANDGANVLPLSCSDYLDYRPTCQLAATVCNYDSSLTQGAWSEKSLWLTGRLPATAVDKPRAPRWQAAEGGYFLMRGPHTQLMTRATNYKDRPGQCDMLHVDLWYKSHNILRDAGSYRYYHEDPSLKQYFYSTAAHNTANVAGTEQMIKGPNFLWLSWPRASAEFDADGRLVCRARFRGAKPYTHHRTIERREDHFTIVDEVSCDGGFALAWRLAPDWHWQQTGRGEFTASFANEGYRLVLQAGPDMVASLSSCWESLYYGERTACPQIVATGILGCIKTEVGPLSGVA